MTVHEIIKEYRGVIDAERVSLYREYADGTQTMVLTDRQKDILRGILSNDYCDNVCHQVISDAADRLSILRYECEDVKVREFLTQQFVVLHIDDIQGEIHYNSLRDGNTALAVQWNNDTNSIELIPELWWDGCDGVWFYYLDGVAQFAVKEWTPKGKNTRRVVYYPDRIERYESSAQDSWVAYSLPDDPSWPVPWTDADGNPLGIPIMHFPNAGRGEAQYGKSELFGGVLGFQDQLNDLQYAMSAAGQFTGYQMYFACGVKPRRQAGSDGTVTELGPEVRPGAVWWSEKDGAHFGTLPAGDISQLINLYMLKLKSVCRMTRTPLHAITGDWPSGTALIRAEQPAVGKATRQARRFRTSWTDLAHMCVKLTNRFSVATRLNTDKEGALIQSVMAPVEKKDALAIAEEIRTLEGVISTKEALRKLGYTEDRVNSIYDELVQERADKAVNVLGAFNAGNATP